MCNNKNLHLTDPFPRTSVMLILGNLKQFLFYDDVEYIVKANIYLGR